MCRFVPGLSASAGAIALSLLASLAHGQVIFSDDFTSGPSPLWENQRGDWTAVNGEYAANAPTNNPPTCSTVPFVLGDLELEVDLLDVIDGGIWVHVDQAGLNGVLLVTGGDGQSGRGFYWHTVHGGSAGGALGRTGVLFNQNDDLHLRITVVGDVYSLYLNGEADPVTSLTTSEFPTGRVGLYDYAAASERFDNVVLRQACRADFNHDGFVNPDDLADFITCFFLDVQFPGICAEADFNADTFRDPDDLADFITVFFTSAC